MIRHLLATTALVAAVATGAHAQNSDTMNTGTEAPGASTGVYEFEVHTLAPTATTGFLATNMIGKSVRTGETDEADAIGDINDVIIARDGTVRAVIVGVGGFLGMGEKEVALDFDRLSFSSESDDQFMIVSDASKEELENAPEYERPDYIPDWMTTENVRDEMDQVADNAEQPADMTDETVQADANDPVRKAEPAEGTVDQAMTTEETVTGAPTDEPVDQAMNTETDPDAWTAEQTRIDATTVSTEALIGADVYTGQDENIGEISQVLIDEEGKAEAVVLDVGGFLGFGEKPVAVSYDSLRMFETGNGDLLVTAPFSKEELENAPDFEPAAYKENKDSVLLKG